jgi:hypothetical protein
MATEPIFTAVPVVGLVTINTANTARDGSGTLGTVLTGGTNGSRVSRITIQAPGSTTTGMVRLFLSNGTTAFLWREVPVINVTVTASTPGFSYIFDLTGEYALILPATYSLRASTNNAETFNVIAEGGDY